MKVSAAFVLTLVLIAWSVYSLWLMLVALFFWGTIGLVLIVLVDMAFIWLWWWGVGKLVGEE